MDVITLRIPSELKEKMRKRPDINWSEVVRDAVAKRGSLIGGSGRIGEELA